MVRRLIHSMQPIQYELERLEPPVLFIWGEKDCFGFPEAAAALSDGERVRLARLADAGHLPWLDEPTLSAELIARFMAGAREGDGQKDRYLSGAAEPGGRE